MTAGDVRELSGMTTIEPNADEAAELIRNPAWARFQQFLFDELDQCYERIATSGTPATVRDELAGRIQVLDAMATFSLATLQIAQHTPPGDDRLVALDDFRMKLEKLGETYHAK